MRRNIFSKTLLAASALLLLTHCGTKATTTPLDPTFTNIYTTVLKTACIECHVPGGSAAASGAQIDFTTQATAYSSLVSGSVSATDSATICAGVKLVKAGGPRLSYLAAVLFTDYDTPPSGFAGIPACSPYTAHHQDQHLSSDEETMIISWIQAGALNN